MTKIHLLFSNLMSKETSKQVFFISLLNDQDCTFTPKIQKLIWGHPESMKILNQKFDIIIGSDIVYYKEAVEPLFTTVLNLLEDSPDSIFILCNQANRLNANYQLFRNTVEKLQVCTFDETHEVH